MVVDAWLTKSPGNLCSDIAIMLFLQETLVHSSNSLAIQALKCAKEHLSLVKSCITFSEVTIPSISAQSRQFDLFLETAEVGMSVFGTSILFAIFGTYFMDSLFKFSGCILRWLGFSFIWID